MKTKLRYFFIMLALLAGFHQTTAQAQNLFEASSGNGSIYEFTTNGVQSTFASGLHSPHGLAFDSAGDLFVADTGSGSILEYTNSGATPSSSYVIFASGFADPDGLAFNSAGNLFLSDYTTGDIYKFTNNGAMLSSNYVIFASGLNPHGVACDSVGNLFVQSGSGDIYEYTTNGVQSAIATGLVNSYGLACDSAGDLFAANSGANNILEFTNNAGTLSTNSTTFASGSGLDNPYGLTFNSAGILFVGNNFNGTVYEYANNGVQSTFVNGSAYFSVGLAFQPAPVPLNIASFGNQSVLFWPASATNYVLQSTTNLSAPNWITASDAVTVIAVTVTNTSPARFFRLQLQQ